MTLSTNIWLLEPANARELFEYCQSLLGDPAMQTTDHVRAGENRYGTYVEPESRYANRIGQGLPAILWVAYAEDAPLLDYTEEDRAEDPEYYEGRPFNEHCLRVYFDTAYGYRSSTDAGCEDLHAWLVSKVGEWCEERHIRWAWQNEFTGERFFGFEGLSDFGDVCLGALKVGV